MRKSGKLTKSGILKGRDAQKNRQQEYLPIIEYNSMVNEKTLVANTRNKPVSPSPKRQDVVHEHVIKSGKYKLKKDTRSYPNERDNPILDIKGVQPKVKQYVIRF